MGKDVKRDGMEWNGHWAGVNVSGVGGGCL